MNDLRQAAQQALEALKYFVEDYQSEDGLDSMKHYAKCNMEAITALKAALEQPDRAQRMRDAGYTRRPTLREMAEPVQESQCNPHPKAPHSFMRNASHNEDRYVCECEGWEPYEAGYQAGMEAALRAQS